jgi:rhodanese-related sulfurtransferase
MNTKLATAVLIGAVSITGCHALGSKAEKPAVNIVSVPDVARFVKDKSAVIYDANGADTRAKYGVVPGAILLTDHKEYPLTQLPAEKGEKLVFYCGGTMCRASDAAAERAVGAGYTNVNVMRDGIKGWASAGQPTSVPQS